MTYQPYNPSPEINETMPDSMRRRAFDMNAFAERALSVIARFHNVSAMEEVATYRQTRPTNERSTYEAHGQTAPTAPTPLPENPLFTQASSDQIIQARAAVDDALNG